MASSQCLEKSVNGKRCKRMTMATNQRCTTHQTSKESAKLFRFPTKDCMQCRAMINGERCKRRTCGTKYFCVQHLKIMMNLRKKGNNLFANADIPKGTVIDRVNRRNNPTLTGNAIKTRYPITKGKSSLVFDMGRNRNYDLNSSTISSLARFIPDCDGPAWGSDRSKCNIRSARGPTSRPIFVTSRNIPKDEMLRIPYGQDYFTDDGGNRKISDRRRSHDPERSRETTAERTPVKQPSSPSRRSTLGASARGSVLRSPAPVPPPFVAPTPNNKPTRSPARGGMFSRAARRLFMV